MAEVTPGERIANQYCWHYEIDEGKAKLAALIDEAIAAEKEPLQNTINDMLRCVGKNAAEVDDPVAAIRLTYRDLVCTREQLAAKDAEAAALRSALEQAWKLPGPWLRIAATAPSWPEWDAVCEKIEAALSSTAGAEMLARLRAAEEKAALFDSVVEHIQQRMRDFEIKGVPRESVSIIIWSARASELEELMRLIASLSAEHALAAVQAARAKEPADG